MMRSVVTALRILAASVVLSISSASSAEWANKTLENPMDGDKRGIASVMGDNGLLIVKCDSGPDKRLYANFIGKGYLGYSSRSAFRPFKYRFDDGQVTTMTAYYGPRDAIVSNIGAGKGFVPFMTGLLTAKKLAVELDNLQGVPTYFVFDVTGAKAAVGQAAATCGDTQWLHG